MTHPPDDPNDPANGGSQGRDEGRRGKLDEDAAWREIVAHYGDEPSVDDLSSDDERPADAPESREQSPPDARPEPPEPPSNERLRGLFRPTWDDPLQTDATWEDEGHFVPPEPPPVTVADPRRRAAWLGLFGSPFIMLLAVVLGWTMAHWVLFLLAVSFAGGFIYLVATMPNRRDGSGDDGAVV